METASPLPDPLIEMVAYRFRVIGEPMRIRVLEQLHDHGATVGELAARLGSSQQNVSKHLGILHRAGILKREKRGTSVVYAVADQSVFEMCDLVCGQVREQLSALSSQLET